MKRKVVLTKDGSSSLYLPDKDEHYHSSNGAVQESKHVFIQNGLYPLIDKKNEINILEVGFGSGLNALLTLQAAIEYSTPINYYAIEPFPLSLAEVNALNYLDYMDKDFYRSNFHQMHSQEFALWETIHSYFSFIKYREALLHCSFDYKFDLIYYDAFGPRAHPEMWEEKSLAQVVKQLEKDGVLVTYCVKGSVKRCLKKLGLQVKKLPGPPGKREMMIASADWC